MSQKFSPTDDLRDLRDIYTIDNGLSKQERAALAVLVTHRNGKTGQCNPSLTTIAKESGFDRSTVARALKRLEDAGHLTRQQTHDGQTWGPTHYVIHAPKGRGSMPKGSGSQQLPSGSRQLGVVDASNGGSGSHPPERTKGTNERGTDGAAKRKTALPDSWIPNDGHRQLATELGLDIDGEVDEYRDHAKANGRMLKDWDAAFRNWLRKSRQFKSEKTKKGGGYQDRAADGPEMDPEGPWGRS